MKLFLTGERFSGSDAVRMGFVHRAVPADELRRAVLEEIDMIRLGGPEAVKACKKLVREMGQFSRDKAFEHAGQWSRAMFDSAEGQEGIAAFREKRAPAWIRDDSQ